MRSPALPPPELPRSTLVLPTALLLLLLTSASEATTLGYFRAEDGPGSSHTTWVNTANAATPGFSDGGNPVQNSTEVFGAVVPQTGAANTGSYYLDGTNAIQIGTGTDYNVGTGDFTFEFWFKTNGSSAAHPILLAKSSYATSDLGWGASIEDHNRDYIGGGVAPGTGGTTGELIPEDVVNGIWHHFAMVLDRSSAEVRGYLDGEHRVTDTWGAAAADVTNAQSTYIGRRDGSTIPGHFVGWIDEVRITQAALQPSQLLNVIPEPSTALLLGIGLSALAVRREKR